jgi:hypothetical protein
MIAYPRCTRRGFPIRYFAGPRPGQLDLFTRRVRQPKPALEFALHVMVADTLKVALKPGWRASHFPSGEHRTPETAARLKRMGVAKGWPDFVLLSPQGQAHFLELKRRGEHLDEAQAAFAAYCVEHGYPHAVAHTLAEAVAQLRQWGAVN